MCQIPYTINIVQVKQLRFKAKVRIIKNQFYGSTDNAISINHPKQDQTLLAALQGKVKVRQIWMAPLLLGRPLTPIAIANPSIKTNGVTTAVYVSVNAKAL